MLAKQVFIQIEEVPSQAISIFPTHCTSDIYEELGLQEFQNQCFMMHKGRIIKQNQLYEQISHGDTIRLLSGLRGGKGGFGSLLRGQALAKRNTNNFDASKDLQGRRIRMVNMHKKLLEWMRKKKEEDVQVKLANEAYKKQQSEIKSYQTTVKLKQEFKDKIEKWDKEVGSSVQQGLKRNKSSASQKTQQEEQTANGGDPKKKVKTIETEDKKIIIKVAEKAPQDEQKKEIEQQEQPKIASVQQQKSDGDEVKPAFDIIELKQINALEELVNLGGDHLKHELSRLGLKCGGSVNDRAQRLWDIKQDPNLMFSKKYIAKGK